MKANLLAWILFGICITLNFVQDVHGQEVLYPFEPSIDHPYGLPNPEAPPQIVDWAPLIGSHTCHSVTRNPDGTWGDTLQMTWRWKYIMNGWAVQDETLKSDGTYAGSIRQYIPDSNQWNVHYYSSGTPVGTLPNWLGDLQKDGKIILYRSQKAPNGMEGFYKINFNDITDSGFSWLGEWVTPDESIKYPTWEIFCKKSVTNDPEDERSKVMQAIRAFSQAYMDLDYDAIVNAYTVDGKIFPNNLKILQKKEDILKYWTVGEGTKILHHKIMPEEITVLGDHAYDYGYYEGKTQLKNGDVSEWQGKYVIVWKKVGEEWKMYLDIWNRVTD